MNWYRIAAKQIDFVESFNELIATDGTIIQPTDEIVVYHATTPEAAEILLSQGFNPAVKPQKPPTIIDNENVAKMLGKNVGDPLDYEPGRGMGKGLYVGVQPRALSQFGDIVLSVQIRVGDLSSPPERPRLSPIRALLVNDGYINKPVPASSFGAMT